MKEIACTGLVLVIIYEIHKIMHSISNFLDWIRSD